MKAEESATSLRNRFYNVLSPRGDPDWDGASSALPPPPRADVTSPLSSLLIPLPFLLWQFGLLTGLGALALMIWLMATPHSQETEQKRLGMLAGFALLTGML